MFGNKKKLAMTHDEIRVLIQYLKKLDKYNSKNTKQNTRKT